MSAQRPLLVHQLLSGAQQVPRLLELRGKPEKRRLVGNAAPEMDTHGKAIRIPGQWQRDCRMPGAVEDRGEGDEIHQPLEEELGVTMVPFKMMVYLSHEDRYVPMDEVPEGAKTDFISGTAVCDDYLSKGIPLPEWFRLFISA